MKETSSVQELPDYLINTYKLLKQAFPAGIKVEEYFPLLAALYDNMSDRNLAKTVAYFTNKDYGQVLNDVYRVASSQKPDATAVEQIKQQLLPHGYNEWLAE